MDFRHCGAKILITCVTLFAFNALAEEPALKPKITAPEAGPKAAMILDNSLSKNLKDLKMKPPVEGPRSGGGGNSCALSIHQNTEKLISLLADMPNLLTKNQKDTLLFKISEAKFYIADSLSLDGQLKDAINYPNTNEIFITNRLCGLDLLEVQSRAMAILLHEYLGLARIDDREYQISGAFLQNYDSYVAKGYSFTANNSYIASTGQCVQSVLHIQQIGNNLIVASTSKSSARILALSKDKVAEFRALAKRVAGAPISVKVEDKSNDMELEFTSKSCGNTRCDFLTVQNSEGLLGVFKNALYGLAVVDCK